MKNIIRFFIRYPQMVNLGICLILILGFYTFSQVQFTFDPEEQPTEIYVDVIYRGASPQEIEERIIARIEDNLRGISGIDRYTSESRENNGRITVELFEETDINEALSDVENAVNRVTNFPQGMEAPVIHKQEMLSPTITLGVTGDVPLQELKDIAKQARDVFMFEGGLSKIHILGLPDEEIEIKIRESDLEKYGLTFGEVTEAVQQSNLNISGGELITPEAKWQIRTHNRQNRALDLQEIVIRSDMEGGRVLLKDVAIVADRFEDRPIRRIVDGKPAAVLQILTSDDEDLLAAASFVRQYVDAFNNSHSGVEITIIDDFSVFIEERVASLWENGVLGLFLVLIILTLFLDKRIAFWVAMCIPLAFFGTFIASVFGYSLSINVISIFGFILVLGMLVDTGVVVAENIYRHYKEFDKNPVQSARDGASEVAMPMSISLLTSAAAFSLFFFLPGRPGTFFTEISFVVITSLAAAFIVAFFFLPALITRSRVMRQSNRQSRWEEWFNTSLLRIRDVYFLPFWNYLMDQRKTVTFITFLFLFLFAIFTIRIGWLPVTFFPVLDDDIQLISLELEPGIPLDTTEKRLMQIEEAVRYVGRDLTEQRRDGQPVVESIERVIGPNSHQGHLRVVLMGGDDRGIPSHRINDRFREETGEIEGVELLRFAGATAADRFGGMPVSISFNGDNFEILRSAAQQLRAALEERDDLIDVADTDRQGLPEIHLELTDAGRQLGITLQDVMNQVRAGYFGIQAQSLQRDDDEIRVWVRYAKSDRQSFRNLKQMKIRTPEGAAWPLHEVARLTPVEELLQINRQDGRRQILVDADVAHPSLSPLSILNDIESEILPAIMETHPGISYEIEGQQREAGRVVAMIRTVGPVILLLVIALMMINFQSISQAFLIFITLPFAIVGAVIGHFVHGVSFSIFSILGIIAMMGILVNNMLVLVTAFNDNLLDGVSFREALTDAVKSRFRPILLTILSTVVGLAPMIFMGGLVSAFLQPPALSIAYGLLFGLLITMVLLPVFLISWNGVKLYAHRTWCSREVTTESVEPAVRQVEHQRKMQEEYRM